MKLILLIILLLIFAIIYLGYPLWQAKKKTLEIEEHTTAYEQHPENPTMHILVAGDSTGVGVGAGINKDSVAGRIGRDFPTADIYNISVSGLKLKELEATLHRETPKPYDLILLQIGANDITAFTSLDNVHASLDSILAYATTHGTQVLLVTSGDVGLAPIFRAPLSTILSSRTRAVRSVFTGIATTYPTVQYVDLYKDRAHDVFLTDINRYYSPDHFHPSGDGYGVWYAAIKHALDMNPPH